MTTRWHHSTFDGWVTVPDGADGGAQAYLALVKFVAVMRWMHTVEITHAPKPKRRWADRLYRFGRVLSSGGMSFFRIDD